MTRRSIFDPASVTSGPSSILNARRGHLEFVSHIAETAVWTDLRPEFSLDDVLRAQGADPAVLRARSPLAVADAAWALAEGERLLEPAVVVRRLAVRARRHEKIVLEEGILKGTLVGEVLLRAEEVVVLVCTVGPRLEAAVAASFAEDPVRALALDAVGSVAVEALSAAACARAEQAAAARGLRATVPIGPGLRGWAVADGQHQLFRLVDAASIGVVLHGSGQMTPRKSASLVLGLGRDVETGGRPCDYCDLREHCHFQEDRG